MIFANPAGFWALLGIPIILLIHFLQREAKRYPSSTRFLLQAFSLESTQGRRFDRLRQSLPLWLQIAGVLLLTWLLAEPRWIQSQRVQPIVVVLDNSASMSAFRDDALQALARELPPLGRHALIREYRALESSASGTPLYHGTHLPALLDALREWQPAAGHHSPEAALRVARSLAGSDGLLLFVTDQEGDPLPFGALRLAVGSPIDNVGFSGWRLDDENGTPRWQARLHNYSSQPQTRQWVLIADGQRSETRRVELAPGETLTLQGEFPERRARLQLALETDRFALDDQLYLVRPVAKRLLLSTQVAPSVAPLVNALLSSLEATAPPEAGEAPDLWVASYNPLNPSPFPEVSIVLLNQEQVPNRHLQGPILSANHPLVSGLDWQGLIARSTPSIPTEEGDLPLLWQGERPLLLLRTTGKRRQLLVNFDLLHSNASRLPAFVLLVHRFVASLREDKIAPEARNLELGQLQRLACHVGPGAPNLLLHESQGTSPFSPRLARQWTVPRRPGFFRVTQGDLVILEGSANFADVREADFRLASAQANLAESASDKLETQSAPDPFRFVWLMLFAATLLLAWAVLGRPREVGFRPGT